MRRRSTTPSARRTLKKARLMVRLPPSTMEGRATDAVERDAACPCTLFSDTSFGIASDPEARSVELGVRFTSDVPGNVIAIRYYRGSMNGGTHTGSLWTATGALLASGTF